MVWPMAHHFRVEGPLVLARGSSRWVLDPPVGPHDDGYVAHMRVEVDDDGLHAATIVTIGGHPAGGPHDLAGFVGGPADDWRASPGTRLWDALEHGMTVEAIHDGRGTWHSP